MAIKKNEPDPIVEHFRRYYLEFKGKIPNNAYPQLWEREKKFRDICDKAAEKGKLRDLLPEWVYESLEDDIKRSLKQWSFLRRTKDPRLSEQARKHIRRAWEALHLPLDRRERTNVLTLHLDYELELMMIRNVLKRLRQVATPSGRIWEKDRKVIASEWDLEEEEVEEIWRQKDKWRPFVRERLARRHGRSKERLDHLIPLSCRVAQVKLHGPIDTRAFRSMASCFEWSRYSR